jgi:hypothetical protein
MAGVFTAKAQSMELAFESLDPVKLWQTPNTVFFPIIYRIDLIYFLHRFSSLELLSLQSKHDILKFAAAHFVPGQLITKGGERLEDKKEGRLERACQTAGSEVLGNDAGC